MSVYIPGLVLPEIEGNRAVKAEIRQLDGKMEFGLMTGGYRCCEQWTYFPIVAVPPHGRLGDLDELERQADIARNYGALGKTAHYKLKKLINEQPTVIPAEEETEGRRGD